MWLLVVAVLRHDEGSSELTSVAQLGRDWVVAHMPRCLLAFRDEVHGFTSVFTSGALSMRRLDWVLSKVMQRSLRRSFDFVLAFSLCVSRVPDMSHGDPAGSPRRYFLAAAESRFVHVTLDRHPLLVNGSGCTTFWRRCRSVLLFLLILCAIRRDKFSARGLRL